MIIVLVSQLYFYLLWVNTRLALCLKIEWWRDYWTVSDVIEQSGVTERYLANAIISDKSKWR